MGRGILSQCYFRINQPYFLFFSVIARISEYREVTHVTKLRVSGFQTLSINGNIYAFHHTKSFIFWNIRTLFLQLLLEMKENTYQEIFQFNQELSLFENSYQAKLILGKGQKEKRRKKMSNEVMNQHLTVAVKQIKPRRSHCKSRNGCLHCKQRRVKVSPAYVT